MMGRLTLSVHNPQADEDESKDLSAHLDPGCATHLADKWFQESRNTEDVSITMRRRYA